MNPNKLYLTQTDTTVGFLSADAKKLSSAKSRDQNQPFLICVDSFEKLKKLSRVPKEHKKLIRRVKKTSFLYTNKRAIRVVKEHRHVQFLKKFNFLYSTSANKHKRRFNLEFALSKAEIIVEDSRGFYEKSGSNIFKLGKSKLQRLR